MNNPFPNQALSSYIQHSRKLLYFISITAALAFLITRILIIFTYNGEIGGIDNNFVYAVTRGMAGYNIYPDPSSLPYAVNPYSPLYFSICIGMGKLIHINPDEPIHVYQLCRTVSFICDLATLLLLYKILSSVVKAEKIAAFSITVLFACLLTYLGYTFCRVDSLYLCFYGVTIYFLLTKDRRKPYSGVLPAALTVLTIFSKQSGIVLPVIILFAYVLEKKYRYALLYFSALIVFFILASLSFIYISGYDHLFHHTIQAINNRIDLSWFYVNIQKRLSDSLLVLLLYIPLTWSVRHFFNGDSITKKSLSGIFLIQLVFSAGTALKWGSTLGYFNESLFLGLIITAYLIKDGQASSFNDKAAWILPLYILFLIHIFAQEYLFHIQKQKEKKSVYLHQKEIRDYLQPKLDGHFVLDLGPQNANFYKVLLYKETAVPNFDGLNCCTLPDQTFNYAKLKTDLESGTIKYLIMRGEDSFESIWGVPLSVFEKDTVIHGEVLYKFTGHQ